MNRIVRQHYPASKLPADLRQGLDAGASVTVTIQQEPVARKAAGDLHQQLIAYRRTAASQINLHDAVSRVRELRNEWDD